MKPLVKTILIFTILLSLIMTCLSACGAVIIYKYKDSKVEEELLRADPHPNKTEFYYFERKNDTDKSTITPKLLEDAHLSSGINYKYTPLSETPDNLINAFIAIEDKRFWEHGGIDPIRSTKAVLNYLTGGERLGGSTITQQLVKNLTGRNEATIDRKLREGFSAIKFEKEYDKSEILEQYLNVINLSRGCRGIGAAAEYYYSKKTMDLTLSECAVIAAITNNPSLYDPISHPENNLKRRNIILKCMRELGYISESEYSTAVAEPICLNISKTNNGGINSWYIDMVTRDVIDDLCEKYGLTQFAASLMLYRGGYKIYIAIDPDVQKILDEYYSDEYNFPIDNSGDTAQSAMIIIDPYNGDILGVAGAIGTKRGNRLQSFATDTKRPPGSTIKPLSIYAPAIEKGLVEWSSIFDDSPALFIGKDKKPWPQNVDRIYRGEVDVKYAVEHSLNTVPVKILDLLGAEETMDFLKNDLRISSLDESSDSGPASLALGQPSGGITLRELTAAYSIFEEGIMSKARSYYKVTDSSGKIILDNPTVQEAVISKESAAIMTKLLQCVVESGTAAGKVTLNKKTEVAGKSGTSANNCDRLFVGYTPEILAGVWFGYEYPKNLEEFGGNLSVYIWDDIISRIYDCCEQYQKAEFTVPDTVQRLSYPSPINSANCENESQKYDVGWFNVKNHK